MVNLERSSSRLPITRRFPVRVGVGVGVPVTVGVGVGVLVTVGVGVGVGAVDDAPMVWPAAAAAEIAEDKDEIHAVEICEAPETPLIVALWAARASVVSVGIANWA